MKIPTYTYIMKKIFFPKQFQQKDRFINDNGKWWGVFQIKIQCYFKEIVFKICNIKIHLYNLQKDKVACIQSDICSHLVHEQKPENTHIYFLTDDFSNTIGLSVGTWASWTHECHWYTVRKPSAMKSRSIRDQAYMLKALTTDDSRRLSCTPRQPAAPEDSRRRSIRMHVSPKKRNRWKAACICADDRSQLKFCSCRYAEKGAQASQNHSRPMS